MRKDDYSDEEWNLLSELPYAIFAYVSSSDGHVGEEELRFRQEWTERKVPRIRFSNDQMVNVYIQGVFQHGAPTGAHVYDEARVHDLLRSFKTMMSRRPAQERVLLCRAFAQLAQETADAAGPFFGGRVTKAEQKAVDNIIKWM